VSRSVQIHYHRPPDRTEIYIQTLLLDDPEVKVSFHPSTPVTRPLIVDGRTVLAPGSPVVWFTFPDRWHDIGRFHAPDGTFTGLYANVLTPARLHAPGDDPAVWHTTDLFLDVWVGVDGQPRVLDEDEWARARDRGNIEPALAERARREANTIMEGVTRGDWPPDVVAEWPLARALAALGG
jgi:predicted RNA-binding protein associated with RNAse of E/G family